LQKKWPSILLQKKLCFYCKSFLLDFFSKYEYAFNKCAAIFFDIYAKVEVHFSKDKIKKELLSKEIEVSNSAENSKNSDHQEVIQTAFRDQEEPITHISRAIASPEMRASFCFLSSVPELNLEEEVASDQESPALAGRLSIPVMLNLPECADPDNNQIRGQESTTEKLIEVQEALSDPVLIENVPDSRTVSFAPELGHVKRPTEENDSTDKIEA
jgi:hypothetical protein